jgi:hypothetical protein
MATDTEQRVEQIDPVTLSVINNAFVNVCREMGTAMMRTSYSPIFNEGLDFSCVLFDKRGNMIGQAEFCPAQLAASLFIVRWTVEELEKEENEISYRRRVLHGKIDILRAELVARLQRQVGAGVSPLSEVDVDRLTEILAGKATPSIEA